MGKYTKKLKKKYKKIGGMRRSASNTTGMMPYTAKKLSGTQPNQFVPHPSGKQGIEKKSKLDAFTPIEVKKPPLLPLSSPREQGAFSPREQGAFSPREQDAFSPREQGAFTPREQDAFSPREQGAFTPRKGKKSPLLPLSSVKRVGDPSPRKLGDPSPRKLDAFSPRDQDSRLQTSAKKKELPTKKRNQEKLYSYYAKVERPNLNNVFHNLGRAVNHAKLEEPNYDRPLGLGAYTHNSGGSYRKSTYSIRRPARPLTNLAQRRQSNAKVFYPKYKVTFNFEELTPITQILLECIKETFETPPYFGKFSITETIALRTRIFDCFTSKLSVEVGYSVGMDEFKRGIQDLFLMLDRNDRAMLLLLLTPKLGGDMQSLIAELYYFYFFKYGQFFGIVQHNNSIDEVFRLRMYVPTCGIVSYSMCAVEGDHGSVCAITDGPMLLLFNSFIRATYPKHFEALCKSLDDKTLDLSRTLDLLEAVVDRFIKERTFGKDESNHMLVKKGSRYVINLNFEEYLEQIQNLGKFEEICIGVHIIESKCTFANGELWLLSTALQRYFQKFSSLESSKVTLAASQLFCDSLANHDLNEDPLQRGVFSEINLEESKRLHAEIHDSSPLVAIVNLLALDHNKARFCLVDLKAHGVSSDVYKYMANPLLLEAFSPYIDNIVWGNPILHGVDTKSMFLRTGNDMTFDLTLTANAATRLTGNPRQLFVHSNDQWNLGDSLSLIIEGKVSHAPVLERQKALNKQKGVLKGLNVQTSEVKPQVLAEGITQHTSMAVLPYRLMTTQKHAEDLLKDIQDRIPELNDILLQIYGIPQKKLSLGRGILEGLLAETAIISEHLDKFFLLFSKDQRLNAFNCSTRSDGVIICKIDIEKLLTIKRLGSELFSRSQISGREPTPPLAKISSGMREVYTKLVEFRETRLRPRGVNAVQHQHDGIRRLVKFFAKLLSKKTHYSSENAPAPNSTATASATQKRSPTKSGAAASAKRKPTKSGAAAFENRSPTKQVPAFLKSSPVAKVPRKSTISSKPLLKSDEDP